MQNKENYSEREKSYSQPSNPESAKEHFYKLEYEKSISREKYHTPTQNEFEEILIMSRFRP